MTTEYIFLSLVFSSFILFYYGIEKNLKLVTIFLSWQIIVGLVSFTHFFEVNPKTFPLTLIGNICLIIYLQNKIKITSRNSIFWLSINIFRIPVEFILFQLYLEKKIPRLMTFEGWNFDIIIGITASIIFTLKFIFKKEINTTLFFIWNILGLVFLSFIVSLALLSSPLPIQQLGFDQPNIAVLFFPYSLLPSSIVLLAFLSHILFLKSYLTSLTQKSID